jgi:DNA adenine methylase
LAPRTFLSEIDDDVAAVWKAIFSERNADVEWLCERIRAFEVGAKAVDDVLRIKPQTLRGRAFKAIVRNRMSRGGLMANGAGLLRRGENGNGLASRWYSETLVARIQALREIRHRITFEQSDALEVIARFAGDPDSLYFIDPPYTAGGNHAGRRLYTHNEVDHQALFELVASVAGRALMTYHDVPEVRSLAEQHGFEVRKVSMKTTHHKMQSELLILKL